MQKNGFTLLELLVVVLIIGVLTSIVVPQYLRAVARTRISEMVLFAGRVHEEQKAYFLLNGIYASDLSKLDINWDSCNGGLCSYGKMTASIGSNDFSVIYWVLVSLKGVPADKFPHIETYSTKRFECLTLGYESNAEICQMFGGRTRSNNPSYYYMDNL